MQNLYAENLAGAEHLHAFLDKKRHRVLLRYAYYESKNGMRDLMISTPPQLRGFVGALGWCGRAVDALADRLDFKGFKNDGLGIAELYRVNNPDVLFDSGILGSLISSCDFVYIYPDDEGRPRLQIIDGSNATGRIDPTTGLLLEGYAVLERGEKGEPITEAYFLPHRTEYYRGGRIYAAYEHPAPAPLLVPIVYKPDATRPFGHSRITRACMAHVQSALRTLKRSEVSAEFYSYPQRYILGLEQDLGDNKWSAAMSSMLTITKDRDGDKPSVGQFQQQSQQPHVDQLRSIASLFAGETGLTINDLGYVQDNPASADAIRASHDNLRIMGHKAQKNFGTGFINAGYLAACLRDDREYKREAIARTGCIWAPMFEPDASSLSGIGDGVMKINQAIPGFVDAATLSELTGIFPGEA